MIEASSDLTISSNFQLLFLGICCQNSWPRRGTEFHKDINADKEITKPRTGLD